MWRSAAGVLAVAALVGCGGDFCSASISDLEGTYEFTVFDEDGDRDLRIEIEIDAEGEVTADVYQADGDFEGTLDCTTEEDQLCDLQVTCKTEDGNNGFSFTLRAKD